MSEEKKVTEAAEEQQKTGEKGKGAGVLKRIVFCAAVFVVVLIGGGPVGNLLNGLTAGISVIRLDWTALFRLILMVSGLALVGILIHLAFARWTPKSNHGKTMSTLANSAIRYVLALIGILWGLSILGVDVNALLAGAGVVALIIGFGAESLIADVITGIVMLFEHQYEVGDIIVVGDFRGTVTQIGIRTTSISDSGGNVKIINNSDVRNLINRSANKSVAVCDLGVTYDGAAVRKAEAILAEALPRVYKENKEQFKAEPKYLGVQQLSLPENAAILRVIAEVEEADVYSVQRLLNRELLLALEDGGISNPGLEVVVQHQD